MGSLLSGRPLGGGEQMAQACANAFHENAVYVKSEVCDFDVVFDVVLPKAYLSFLAEPFAERPGAVKGAIFAAQRTLDGEDRSATLPLGKKGRPMCAMFLSDPTLFPKVFVAQLLSPPFHTPSR